MHVSSLCPKILEKCSKLQVQTNDKVRSMGSQKCWASLPFLCPWELRAHMTAGEAPVRVPDIYVSKGSGGNWCADESTTEVESHLTACTESWVERRLRISVPSRFISALSLTCERLGMVWLALTAIPNFPTVGSAQYKTLIFGACSGWISPLPIGVVEFRSFTHLTKKRCCEIAAVGRVSIAKLYWAQPMLVVYWRTH